MYSRLLLLSLGFLFFSSVFAQTSEPDPLLPPPAPRVDYDFSDSTVKLIPSRVVRTGDTATIRLELDSALWSIVELPVEVGSQTYSVVVNKGKGEIPYVVEPGTSEVPVRIHTYETMVELRSVAFPLWMSLLPPLIAIVLALVLKEVYISLFLGVFVGAATLAVGESGSLSGIVTGFLRSLEHYVVEAVADKSHVSILVFSLLIGAMVAVISRNGGMQGVVNRLARLAKDARSGQLATYMMGIAIFFDDYANSLVVGNTMRPVTDRLRISREKLSYLVDSTAAPVAALAFVTTWIGAELGYISDGISQLRGFPADQSPYLLFLSSLPYSFYPILTLLFILGLILTGRDFGPMLKAERRARTTGRVSRLQGKATDAHLDEFAPAEGVKPRARYAVIPVLTLVGGVIWGLFHTGYQAEVWANEELGLVKKLSETIGGADSYAALLWASITALSVAIVLSIASKRLSLKASMESMMSGFRAMMGALVILALAWALGGVTKDMHTAGFLTELLGSQISPVWLPALAFVLSALIAFSTGSSWSTMAIMFPIMIPLVWEAGLQTGWPVDDILPILHNVIASVLAGSVVGDHISPISDTTILSSLASNCDHLDHVRTQIPYALVVGGVSLLLGVLPTSLGLPAWAGMLLGIVFLALVIARFGKRVEIASQ